MRRPAFALLSLSLLLPAAAPAQVVDISGCRAVQNTEDRFRCYEALEGQTGAAAPTAAPQAAPQLPKETGTAGSAADLDASERELAITVDNFGDQQLRQARVKATQGGEVELQDSVVALKRLRPNLWQITLASGQVWRQMTSKAYHLEAGDEVRIYPSDWGKNYRLSAVHLQGFIQVQRLR